MLVLCKQFTGKDDVVICDNADLYIGDEFSDILSTSQAIFLVVCKRVGLLKISGEEGGFYCVHHTCDFLSIEKDRRF